VSSWGLEEEESIFLMIMEEGEREEEVGRSFSQQQTKLFF
jgi:hypothetical protein